MSISTKRYTIARSHGALAVEESGHVGIPVLLIHGNSFCRGVFRNQMPQGFHASPHAQMAVSQKALRGCAC